MTIIRTITDEDGNVLARQLIGDPHPCKNSLVDRLEWAAAQAEATAAQDARSRAAARSEGEPTPNPLNDAENLTEAVRREAARASNSFVAGRDPFRNPHDAIGRLRASAQRDELTFEEERDGFEGGAS